MKATWERRASRRRNGEQMRNGCKKRLTQTSASGKIGNMKRTCAVCGCNTKQFATEEATTGQPVWECGNCGTQVTRKTRRLSLREAAKAAALDNLFETLTEGL